MPRFATRAHSLFGEILDWVLAPLLLLWPISLALSWLVAHELAARPFDRALALQPGYAAVAKDHIPSALAVDDIVIGIAREGQAHRFMQRHIQLIGALNDLRSARIIQSVKKFCRSRIRRRKV